MRVGLVSLDQAWENKAVNRDRVSAHVDQAVREGARLVVLPEMTLTGFSMSVESIAEDPAASATVSFFSELAAGRTAIAFGVVHRDGSKGANKLIVIDSNGRVLADYHKMHPFTLGNENRYYTAGDATAKFSLEGVRFGCTVCYDLRFPALYQALAPECDAILTIASWPKARVEHWDTLLRARAIENQVIMLGVNRVGVDGDGREYARSSRAYGPLGEVLVPVSSGPSLDLVDIDTGTVVEARRTMAVIDDRRDELYAGFYSRKVAR